MQVGGTAELRAWILSFGAGAEVLEPASLRSEVVKELKGAGATRAYRERRATKRRCDRCRGSLRAATRGARRASTLFSVIMPSFSQRSRVRSVSRPRLRRFGITVCM